MNNYMFEDLSMNELDNIDGGGLFGLIGGAIIGGVIGTLVGAGGAIVVAATGGSKEQISNVLAAGAISGATYGAFAGASVSGPF